jgi:hypothetical protein
MPNLCSQSSANIVLVLSYRWSPGLIKVAFQLLLPITATIQRGARGVHLGWHVRLVLGGKL